MSLYNLNSEEILRGAIDALTTTCQVLTDQNKQLNRDIDGLKAKVKRMEEKHLLNQVEKE